MGKIRDFAKISPTKIEFSNIEHHNGRKYVLVHQLTERGRESIQLNSPLLRIVSAPHENRNTGSVRLALEAENKEGSPDASITAFMQLLKDLDKVLTRTAVDRSTRWFGKKMTMSEVLARQDFSVKEEVEGSGGRVKQAHLVPKINADEPVGKGLLETIRNLGAKGDPQRTYICVLQIAGVWFRGGRFGFSWYLRGTHPRQSACFVPCMFVQDSQGRLKQEPLGSLFKRDQAENPFADNVSLESLETMGCDSRSTSALQSTIGSSLHSTLNHGVSPSPKGARPAPPNKAPQAAQDSSSEALEDSMDSNVGYTHFVNTLEDTAGHEDGPSHAAVPPNTAVVAPKPSSQAKGQSQNGIRMESLIAKLQEQLESYHAAAAAGNAGDAEEPASHASTITLAHSAMQTQGGRLGTLEDGAPPQTFGVGAFGSQQLVAGSQGSQGDVFHTAESHTNPSRAQAGDRSGAASIESTVLVKSPSLGDSGGSASTAAPSEHDKPKSAGGTSAAGSEDRHPQAYNVADIQSTEGYYSAGYSPLFYHGPSEKELAFLKDLESNAHLALNPPEPVNTGMTFDLAAMVGIETFDTEASGDLFLRVTEFTKYVSDFIGRHDPDALLKAALHLQAKALITAIVENKRGTLSVDNIFKNVELAVTLEVPDLEKACEEYMMRPGKLAELMRGEAIVAALQGPHSKKILKFMADVTKRMDAELVDSKEKLTRILSEHPELSPPPKQRDMDGYMMRKWGCVDM